MSSKEYFARVAGDWDRMRKGFFSEAVRERALALARVRPGQTAADLGAGTGFVTEALVGAGLGVFAVDREPGMLALLRERFGPRAAALLGEAEALPLPPASVDHVFANMFLHHVENPGAAIAEMARVARPGGGVVVTDLDAHDLGFLLTEHHDRWPGFARADVEGWLRAAGLEDVRVEDCGCDCCADSACGCASARVSIFAAVGRKPLLCARGPAPDPDAAGRLATSFMAGDRPLLCAESVLLAVARSLGVESPLVPRLATGFCSGLSRTCGPCGAFSAGVMALGLALGRDSELDDLDRTYGPAQEFREFFLERFGSTNCRELTGHDLGSPEGLRAYREQGVKLGLCAELLHASAAEVVRLVGVAKRWSA